MADIPIIDSHVHLWPASELDKLAWCTPENPLAKQMSVDEYREATAPVIDRLRGFVYLETDRKNDESQPDPASGWKGPLEEVSWLRRMATGQPRDGEGHSAADASLCLALIPWAPIASGPEALARYLEAAEKEAGPETWAKVKGFRYLLQDKPKGTMLTDDFIEGLKLLGKRGFVFDTGVDQHRRGRHQLEECVEMIDRAHEGVPDEEKVTFIINHMAKPDLGVINPADPSFIAWRVAMYTLSKCNKVYIKLSGAFTEMPESLRQKSPADIFLDINSWLLVLLAAFGPSRLMFGSDWPVCTLGAAEDGGKGAWKKWHDVVARMAWMATLSEEDQRMLFGGTAAKAYGLGL